LPSPLTEIRRFAHGAPPFTAFILPQTGNLLQENSRFLGRGSQRRPWFAEAVPLCYNKTWRLKMPREMTITVDDTVYETLRPLVKERSLDGLLTAFARSRYSKPAYTEAELEADYRAMAADKEREAEAQEWCNALIGDVE
jgi:hypothetical protein